MRQKFIDAVEAGNLISVRYSLSNELLLDPRGGSYREMKAMAEERLENLYETLDGELPKKAAEEYSEADLMELKNELDSNFCKERLEHYEQVVAVVLREKAEQMDKGGAAQAEGHDEQTEAADTGKYKCECDQQGTEGVGCYVAPAAIGVAAGIVAGGIAKAVGAATSAAVGIAVAAGAAAGAAVKYLKDNDREDEEI